MKFLSGEHRGALCAALSGLLYGLVGYFGVSIMDAQFSIYNMLFWRFLMSGAIVGLIFLFKRNTAKDGAANMLKAFIFGAVFYSMTSILFFQASLYIGTGLAMVISFTFPTIVIFINWLFDRRPIAKIHIGSTALITAGLALLANIREFKFDLIGIGLGILCAFFYAFYIFFSKKTTVSPLASTLMVSLGSAAASLLFALIDGSFIIPVTATVWANVFAMAIICTAIPILLLLEALRTINSEKASILSVLEPVFVVIFGCLLLKEKISLLQALGMTVVLSGALITLLKSLHFANTNHPIE